MGETDLRRGARWLGVAALALGLVAATALAAPPQGNFTVTPNTPNQGEPALFTCKPCPGKAEVAWDLDGVPGFEASGRTATATFDSPGPHTVSMLLTEDDETNTITKTVTVNAPPTVTFDWDPDSPLVGQEVDFQSQVSDPEGNTVTRAWELRGRRDRDRRGAQPHLRRARYLHGDRDRHRLERREWDRHAEHRCAVRRRADIVLHLCTARAGCG